MTNRTREALWEVIEDSIREGVDVTDFIRECREAWTEALRDKIKADDRKFHKDIYP